MDGLEADTQLVKDLCMFAKLTPSALAKRAGLAATTITRPFRGTAATRISQPTFDKLRTAFPNFPGWRLEEPDQIGRHGRDADPHERPDELVYIRQVDIRYAMGDGTVTEEYPSVGLIPFNLGFIKSVTNTTTDRLFIASGAGDSMEPTLLRSDLIMIDTTQTNARQADLVWALEYAGGGYIKRLRRVRRDGEDSVEIMSDNPLVHSQFARLEEVQIVGKVIWVGRQM